MHKVTREDYVSWGGDPSTLVYPFADEPTAGQRVYCLHCGGFFSYGLELVDYADGLLVCPNGDCDGSPMDWSTTPWHCLD
jgi:hypothetical protein